MPVLLVLFVLILFGCNKASEKHSANLSIEERVLLGYSGQSNLHSCAESEDGYAHCGERHVQWLPGKGSPLRDLKDSAFSRIHSVVTTDSDRIFLIESTARGYDCVACAPFLGAAIYHERRDSLEFIESLGRFGRMGEAPSRIPILIDSRNIEYLREDWSETGQGITLAGVAFTSISNPFRRISVQLEEDNSGACAQETGDCYGFQYELPDLNGFLPDSILLHGKGTKIGPDGSKDSVTDTLIHLTRQ